MNTRYKSRYLVITENYLLPLLFIFLVAALILFIFHSSYFTIQNISCEQDFLPCTNPFILAELEKYKGQNIFTLDQETLKTRLIEGNKTIKKVKLALKLPNKLQITLISTTPKVALRLFQENKFVLFDDNLRAISLKTENPNLPTVTVTGSYQIQIGKQVSDPNLAKALSAALTITTKIHSLRSIHLQEDLITLSLPNQLTALLTTTKAIEPQLRLLQAVLSDAKMLEEDDTKLIDVRFNQPVLKSY